MNRDLEKPVVHLDNETSIGLILSYPSGVYYINQTGGYSCAQSFHEGIYLPLGISPDVENSWAQNKNFHDELDQHFYYGPKYQGHCYGGVDEETAEFLEGLFSRHPTINRLSMRVDRGRLKNCMEAWIYVTFNPQSSMFVARGCISGVLTWPNSD